MDPYAINKPLQIRPAQEIKPAELSPQDIMNEMSWSESDWIKSMIAYGGNMDPVVRKKGIKIYQEMLEDDQIKACLEIRKQSRLSTKWTISAADDDNKEAIMYRDYIRQVLERCDGSFEDNLYDIYSAIENGFSISELIFMLLPDGDFKGKMGLSAIKTRDPVHYDFKIDIYGNLLGIVYSGVGANLLPASGGSQPMFMPAPGQPPGSFGNSANPWPRDKFIIYSYNAQFSNWYGKSDLLAAYRSWLSKKHIMKFWNIWLERYAAPFTVFTIDSDQIQKKQVMTEIDNFIRNLSAKAGIRVPKGVSVELIEGSAARSQVYDQAISSHDRYISHALLVPNLLGFSGPEQKGGGSFALGQKQFDAFFWVLDKMGRDTSENIVGEQIIKRLINLSYPNVDPKLMPYFKYEEIDEDSITARSKIVDLLARGGFISQEEEWVREFLTIPKKDPGVVLPIVQPAIGEEQPVPGAAGTAKTPDTKPTPKKTDGIPKESSAAPNKQGKKDMASAIEYVERSPNNFESKVNFVAFGKQIDSLEKSFYTDIEAEMSKIMENVISWVQKKKVIEDGDARMVREMPLNVSSLKDTLRQWLVKIHLDSKLRLLEELSRADVPVTIVKKFADSQGVAFEPWDPLPPRDAINFFNKKVNVVIQNSDGEKIVLTLATSQELSFYDAKSFAISGVIRDDILNDAKTVILNAIKRQDLVGGIKDLKDLFTKYVDTGQMSDGVLLTPGRLFTIIRTNMGEAINEGRRSMMEDPDVAEWVEYWVYSAILDDRTTEYCRCMDGKNFRIEDLPLLNPPSHFNCRSISVPITNPEVDRDGVEVAESCIGRMTGFTDIKREPLIVPSDGITAPDLSQIKPEIQGADLPPTPHSAMDIAAQDSLRKEMAQIITRCPYTACWSDKIHITGGRLNVADFTCDKCKMPFRISSKGDLYLYDAGLEKWDRTSMGLAPAYFKEKMKFRRLHGG